jgi:diguanylate cyclase (GGDEF)-like protein/PAS domain S-box-containing protein
MSACVLGLVIWKAAEARSAALARSETDIKNLSHSLAEHATHTFQAVDVATGGMIDLLKYQNPLPERFNSYLRKTVMALPQLREIGVLTPEGDWKYSSLAELPKDNNSERDYFLYHRDARNSQMRISDPIMSKITGRWTIILTKRISGQDGSFGGILLAAIDSDYFNNFYSTFNIGLKGGISLLRSDGMVLIHWPSLDVGRSLSQLPLFQVHLKRSPVGYYKVISPFDSVSKYVGYEQISQYPIVTTVALSESEILSSWRADLRSDVIVALVMFCTVIMMAALLGAQFRYRLKIEQFLRDREERYRLLADNIADIVLLLDEDGMLLYVSQSVQTVLGFEAAGLVGQSCLDLIHPGDRAAVKSASVNPRRGVSEIVVFRMCRADGTTAWLESNFKLASPTDGRHETRIVSVLRDVSERRAMEEELKSLNSRLAQLATTDGLTGLSNRRTFDGFLRREFESQAELSVLLLDIDNFKGFNDSLGHLAGDHCLTQVAKVVAGATNGTRGLSARYGGEEFVIVLPGVSEMAALNVAEAVRMAIHSLKLPNPAADRGFVTVSVGVASRTEATGSESVLVGEADLALYEAKRRGRNQCLASSSLMASYVEAALAPL